MSLKMTKIPLSVVNIRTSHTVTPARLSLEVTAQTAFTYLSMRRVLLVVPTL